MKKQAVGPLAFALTIALAAPAAGGTTYFVDGACGDDAWSGLSPDCSAPNGPKATIQAAIDVTFHGDVVIVAPSVYPERIDFVGKAIAVQSAEGPEVTVIDAERTGRVVQCGSDAAPGTLLEGFTIANGYLRVDGSGTGAGIYIAAGNPTLRNCIVRDNEADNAAAMRTASGSSPFVDGCSFIDNLATDGCVTTVNSHPIFKDCLFEDNDGGYGGAALVIAYNDGTPPLVINCRFTGNRTGGMGTVVDGGDTLFVNCVFSDNVPGGLAPGALVTVEYPTVINCTFSDNSGYGIYTDHNPDGLTAHNSILWGNSLGSIGGFGAFVYSSDVEGGWPGAGNIDADPLFVQAGMHDVRLAFGSPCINAGNNAALPPDVLDLDGDGNTTEPIPIDPSGAARIQEGVVDMGAYEGGFEPMPPAEGAMNLDQGGFVILIPGGGQLNPMTSAGAVVYNTSGPDNATFVLTQLDGDVHPGAGGFSELSAVLNTETSLADGEFLATLFIPFGADDLGGVGDPLNVNLTYYDPIAGNWALAVAANTAPSPGFLTQYGNRVVSGPGHGWGTTTELGDYGVYWNIVTEEGFVWANVDHSSDFGVGLALCPADCRQTPDGEVGMSDVLALLATWGAAAGGGPCDVDFNGVIDVPDFLALLDAWGPCPLAAAPPPPDGTRLVRQRSAPAPAPSMRGADIDGNGVVEQRDLLILRDAWGPCVACPADFDGDGRVDVTDYLHLAAGRD
jgi:hypothetical protein